MSFPDTDAARRHPGAAAALAQGDAVAALVAVEPLHDAAALRLAGRALLALGDRDGARRTLLAALEAAGGPHAAGAQDTAQAHHALAAVAKAMGEPADAVVHLEAAFAGAPASAHAGLHREAAVLAYRGGDLPVAERHARLALDDAGASAVVAAEDRARLGAILSELGHHADALVQLRHSARQLQAELGAAHPDVIAIQGELADTLEAAGHHEEAEQLHLVVLARCEAAHAPNPGVLVATLLALSALAAARADASASRAWAHRAELLLAGRVPADHPQLLAARSAASG